MSRHKATRQKGQGAHRQRGTNSRRPANQLPMPCHVAGGVVWWGQKGMQRNEILSRSMSWGRSVHGLGSNVFANHRAQPAQSHVSIPKSELV